MSMFLIKNLCFRATRWPDSASARQRDSSEEQQPAGDHRGVCGCRHRCRRGHRGSHLHTPVLRTTKEVSPFPSLIIVGPNCSRHFGNEDFY